MGNEIFAKDSLNKKIKTINGIETIISVEKTQCDQEVFDVSLKNNPHTYYTNGFLSHNCVILDEFSFVQKNLASDFFASVMPIISSGKNSKAIIVSTPNGTDNLYYEIWQQANSKSGNKEGWKPFRIDWWEAGGIRDEKWKEQQIATIGIQRWRQEFGNEFLDSATSKKLVPDDIIEKFRMALTERKNSGRNPGKDLYVTSRDGRKTYVFRMWHEFSPDRAYLATFDVAEGIKKDHSVLYVWDVTETSDVRMCARFSANDISILEFAYATREILRLYADPYVAGESNGISLGFIEQLRITHEYENFVMLGKDHGCGIDSHVFVKTKACLWCRDMMTTLGFGFTIYDPDLVEEMSTFVKKDTKVHDVYAAMGENHDDHMMCLVWACWILNPENVGKYFDVRAEFRSSLGNTYPKFLAPMFRFGRAESGDEGFPSLRSEGEDAGILRGRVEEGDEGDPGRENPEQAGRDPGAPAEGDNLSGERGFGRNWDGPAGSGCPAGQVFPVRDGGGQPLRVRGRRRPDVVRGGVISPMTETQKIHRGGDFLRNHFRKARSGNADRSETVLFHKQTISDRILEHRSRSIFLLQVQFAVSI